MSEIKRIGVLTGGGDCPGLNAVIRAVAKDALHEGFEVVGIEDAFRGLIEGRMRRLSVPEVSGIMTTGGTILGSCNKTNPERYVVGKADDGTPITEDRMDDCVERLKAEGVDALVVIGGDGTMTIASQFVAKGVNCIGVPKTIDNDLHGTDLTFGFSTAVQTATDAFDRVRTTAASHHRVIAVEVMGRHAGWLALHAGVAGGADVILLPEIPFDLDSIYAQLQARAQRGRRYSVICCAEGATPIGGAQLVDRVDPTSPDPIRLGGVARWLTDRIESATGLEARSVSLGHVQRGGTPVAVDRVLATRFGHHAMQLLKEGRRARLVVMQEFKLTDIDLNEAANKQRLVPVDHEIIEAARAVYTCFGDEGTRGL
ncbi:MAG: ATP-dependent 6-phosphofructokinase [Planctomycetota bacterium]